MKQIEITVRLAEKVEQAISKLENKGFKKIRESDIDDIYLSNLNIEMKKENYGGRRYLPYVYTEQGAMW